MSWCVVGSAACPKLAITSIYSWYKRNYRIWNKQKFPRRFSESETDYIYKIFIHSKDRRYFEFWILILVFVPRFIFYISFAKKRRIGENWICIWILVDDEFDGLRKKIDIQWKCGRDKLRIARINHVILTRLYFLWISITGIESWYNKYIDYNINIDDICIICLNGTMEVTLYWFARTYRDW